MEGLRSYSGTEKKRRKKNKDREATYLDKKEIVSARVVD